MPDRQGAWVKVLLPCTLAPLLPYSRPDLRVDFIEFGRNGLEDAIQSRADHRNNQGSDNDPLQDCITGMICEHSFLVF